MNIYLISIDGEVEDPPGSFNNLNKAFSSIKKAKKAYKDTIEDWAEHATDGTAGCLSIELLKVRVSALSKKSLAIKLLSGEGYIDVETIATEDFSGPEYDNSLEEL